MNQKRHLVLYIATSLDGYIATEDESLEWLFKAEGKGDNGYSEFDETVDTVLIGRKTYDWISKNVEGEFPYQDKERYVFSRTSIEDTKDIKFINGDIVNFTNQLKSQEGKKIWIVGGGELLHEFIKEKLVDEIILTIAPTIIGNGIPLFKKGDYQLDLALKGTKTFNQFVELHYQVNK